MTALRVDAHHHLWDLSVRSQPWIDPVDMAPINQSFDLHDLSEAKAALIDRTVVVEAASLVAETEELLSMAAAEPLISGVVGYVDLTSPHVGEQIDRLQEAVGGDRLVGIRSPVQDEPDPRWLERSDVIAGLKAVASRSLVLDDLRPYADHVIAAFGPDRLLFGTDWPVCMLAGSYQEVVVVAEQLIAELSEAERDAVLGANATRVYRLDHREVS